MTLEKIAQKLALKLSQQRILTPLDMESIITSELKKILHADKGKLTEGTIKEKWQE